MTDTAGNNISNPPDAPVQPETPGTPKHAPRHREIIWLVITISLLLVATLPPLINLGRWQRRIANAISRSVGRPVSMNSVSFRLLPWPAFILNDFSVGEDPKFGAEPSLRAPQVVAEPSLLSLWRGRFELSRIELQGASVNLVRNADGRWNIGSVLLQASHIPNAPTRRHLPSALPRFPYIEATETRINLKRGAEKLPYSLLGANFSMWLGDNGAWNIRLDGQPVRTDLALSLDDTGTLHLEGQLHRAVDGVTAYNKTPISMHAEWSQAPLGQVGRLLYGEDPDWSGDADVSADFSGEASRLQVVGRVRLNNLHRQEFTPNQPFFVDASCRGLWNMPLGTVENLGCRMPVDNGKGSWLLHGALKNASTPSEIVPQNLHLTAQHVPATWFVAALGLLHAGAPNAARFTGTANGTLQLADGQLSGALQMPELRIAHGTPEDRDLLLQTVSLAPASSAPANQTLLLTAAPVAGGVPEASVTLSAELNPGGATLHASGTATIPNLRAAAKALHLSDTVFNGFGTAGSANFALASTQSWIPAINSDSATGTASGTLTLHDATWQPSWLTSPIQLPEANAVVSNSSIRWSTDQAILTTGGDATPHRTIFHGAAEVPLHCSSESPCLTQVSLSTPSFDTETLMQAAGWNNQPLLQRLLDRLDSGSTISAPSFRASVQIGSFLLGRLPLRNVVANVSSADAAEHGIRITSLDGQVLHGGLHLQGLLRLNSGTPGYLLDADWNGINAHDAGQLFSENWGGGTLNGSAHLATQGSAEADLLKSTKGTWHAVWLHGSLGTDRFTAWDGEGVFGPTGLAVHRSTMLPGGAAPSASISGTIGWDRTLSLTRSAPGEPAQHLTGTLAEPAVPAPAQ